MLKGGGLMLLKRMLYKITVKKNGEEIYTDYCSRMRDVRILSGFAHDLLDANVYWYTIAPYEEEYAQASERILELERKRGIRR